MIEKREYHRVGLHLHTLQSDGLHHVNEMLRQAGEAGLHLVVVTDHDEVFRGLEKQIRTGTTLLPGIEITTAQGHVVGTFPDIVPEEIPMGRSLSETVDMVRSYGGLVGIPHVGVGPSIASVTPNTVRRLYESGRYVDMIEVLHPAFRERHRQTADKLAEELCIAPVGVDDDHEGNVGRRIVTLVPRSTGNPQLDLQTALRDRTTVAVRSDLPLIYPPRSVPQHVGALFVGFPKKVANGSAFLSTWTGLGREELVRRLGDLHGGK
ncbi:hypothetical protein HYT17_02800 [Candidatus Microgenomates bacterium]|nr:hypothetical protein [Candidatus Microgenomates bacterium]